VCERVRAEVTYETGATGVQTDAVHAWRQRKGVCQDISHLTAGLLRTMGLPARYVSGYLHPHAAAASGGWAAGRGSTRPTACRSARGSQGVEVELTRLR
jgi:transglutaminase-like putative cysteine protease